MVSRGQLRGALGDIAARARGLRVVLSDCDGTLTDGGVYVSASGEAMKRFSLRDGMGVERLRHAGIATVVVTREQSPSAERRCEKLRVRLFQSVTDKAALLHSLCAELEVAPGQLGYIGDDVNDLDVMRRIADAGGLCGAPADAEPEVREAVHFIASRKGGRGAFRDFAESILLLRSNPSDERGLP